MNYITLLATLAGTMVAASSAIAQSTLGDPTPSMGNAAENTAKTTNLNSTLKSKQTSPAELARRRTHRSQLKTCKETARSQYPAGDTRRYAATKQCRQVFDTQKSTWERSQSGKN